jgi:hypothetical protein
LAPRAQQAFDVIALFFAARHQNSGGVRRKGRIEAIKKDGACGGSAQSLEYGALAY